MRRKATSELYRFRVGRTNSSTIIKRGDGVKFGSFEKK